MGTDHYCRMGSKHAICQDYVLAGAIDGVEYGLLSDGCSGKPDPKDAGSPHTDFGARFLVHSARRHLKDMTEGVFPGDMIITQAQGMARQTYLSPSALYATLISAVWDKKCLRTYQTGDGVVAWRTRDGEVSYETIRFDNNAPHYLAYSISPRDHDSYFEACRTATVTESTRRRDGWGAHIVTYEAVDRHVFHRSKCFNPELVELVYIMSDGADSFVQKSNNQPVPLEQVLDQLFNVKVLTGEFLTRRCNAFLHRFCAEQGWVHEDDFSIAGFYLGA